MTPLVVNADGERICYLPTNKQGNPILPSKGDIIVLFVKGGLIYQPTTRRRVVTRIEWRYDLDEILIFTKEIEE